jgi:hypothetical protein
MTRDLQNLDTLSGVLDNIWQMLAHGSRHSEDPFHWPVLGTAAQDGCSLRTVILRQASRPNRTLVCHTDKRSAKVAEIREKSRTSWLFYHPARKIQVRVTGSTTLHAQDSLADQQWADSRITSRLNYCSAQPPGTPMDRPVSGLPDFLLNKIPTLMETEMGRKHFMAVQVHIDLIDWLILKVTGNRRARFEWIDGKHSATWVVP